MSKLVLYDKVVIEQHEHYQKGSFRNKCRLLGPNGIVTLSVPLHKGKHQQKPIREVQISYAQSWYATHWHSIQTAYGSAPFFPHYGEQVKEILYAGHDRLITLNLACLELVQRLLRLPDVSLTSAFSPDSELRDDLRDRIALKNPAPDSDFQPEPYIQVFSDRRSFIANLSILDALFCLGPQTRTYLKDCILSR